jgi:choline dehydrogenase-like flavoprotein
MTDSMFKRGLKALTDRPFKVSAREREILLAAGRAILPASGNFPEFSEADADRLLQFLAGGSAPEIRILLKTLLYRLENEAVLFRMKRMSALARDAREDYIRRRWVDGPLVNRLLFRLFGVMLKGSYYDTPEIYKALGLEFERPPVSEEEPRWTSNVVRGPEVAEDATVEADAVVVGTGAGGAAAALALANAGHAVVMVEDGDLFSRRHFNGRGFRMQRMLYRHYGLTSTAGNVVIPVPLGKTVGGSTTINSGTCFRAPESTLARWRADYGLSGFTAAAMDPHYRKIEALFKTAPADMKHVGKNGEIIARGAAALGWSHGPLVRNAPDCDGQAVCCFGCTSGAKRSTDVSMIPAALEKGARLYCRARAESVILEGNTAAGIKAVSLDTGKRITVRARAVVLALGAIETPRLLMRQKIANSSGQVGRNLSIHPATALHALMDEPVEPQKSIPQGYMIDEFHEDGILMEGGTLPLEMFSMMVPEIGREGQEIMRAYRNISMFGVMICDKSRGRVLPDTLPGAPLAFYRMGREDFSTMRRGIELLVRAYLAAGAREIRAMAHGWKPVRSERDLADNMIKNLRPVDVDISAYHPLGTCHMGGSGGFVCTPDGQTRDVKNLFIADGSLIPPELGVNPQLTIAAVASRVGEFVSSRLC